VFDSLIDRLAAGLPPHLVWGLVPRIVGLLFAIAFLSLSGQVLGLVGKRGISPAHAQLAAMREHFPGPLRFVRWPTWLWLSCSDRMLWALPRLGIVAGLFAAYGGPGSWFALFLCWSIYLSLDVCSLMFPWDCLLLEAGLLALFLPSVPALPQLELATLPLPIAAFAFRFLLIRLMWGFAKLKFIGTKPGDSLYLRGFLAWMPMCTPLGFRLQHAPAWFLRASYAFMWFVEVVCPGLVFFRGLPRVVAALGLSALMGGIWSTGNWGFFNIGYGALCVALLDTQGSVLDTTWALMQAHPFTHVSLFVLLFGSLLYFPVNSWASQTFIHWPYEDITWKRPWLRAMIGLYRTLSPFRMIHAYGVFPPNSSPPIKVIPVFEGSDDGALFKPYGYRYMPTEPDSPCPIVAPHHPRIDHLCVYAGSGMSESDYLGSLVGAGKVIGFSPFSHFNWLERLGQRLLEGEPSVLALLGHNPFPERPPRQVRISLRALSPQGLDASHRWRSRHLGVAFEPRSLEPLAWQHWLPPPELFHPDFVHWRKKSFALNAMLRDQQALDHDAVRAHSDLRADEVEAFWDDFVPSVASGREDYGRVDDIAQAIVERFGKAQLLRFERIAERYVYMLRRRVEPHFYGDVEPKLDKRSNFRFHLLMHEVILDGREAYEATLLTPGLIVERAQHVTDRSLLTFILIVRNQTLRYHGRALRIARCMTNVVEPHIPGILEFKDLVTEWQPPDEEWLPVCTREPNGVWRCPEFLEAE
jgi:hypothetical protein